MKEWYLIGNSTKPNVLSGYETDAFHDFKTDAFSEALESGLAKNVLLYNSSLTKSKKIYCIIQDNTSNTQLKSMERTILTHIGTLKAGMYILFEDRYWLINGYPGNNGIYEKATMVLCQYKIKWQDNDGRIIERWSNITSASKYDVGEFSNGKLAITSNNFTILIPEDDDGSTLDEKRIFLDRNKTNPRKVFKITRSDDVLYLYGETHGGILSFIADKTELNLQVDRPDLQLCDYIESESSTLPPFPQNISATITGLDKLKIGFDRTYAADFKDEHCNIIYPDFTWNLVSEMQIETTISDNNITLLINDEDAVGASFLLQIIIDETVIVEKEITIIDAF